MNRAALKVKVPLILGALSFLMTGLDQAAQGRRLFAAVNLLMVAANLLALRFAGDRPAVTNATLFLANALLAALVSWDYFQQGKVGLPYAWGLVCACCLIAAVIFCRGSGKG